MTVTASPSPDRPEYRGDCRRCAALCCVLPAFARSSDFAVDKPAGVPCRHLTPVADCGIHDRLRPAGFAGCTVYDCFGAGQQVTAWLPGGSRDVAAATRGPGPARAFAAVRQLREMARHLDEVIALHPPGVPGAELSALLGRTLALAASAAQTAAGSKGGELPDVPAHRAEVAARLREASVAVRSVRRPAGRRELAGHDLSGAALAGADLRAADLRGADLTGVLFVTEPQLTAAAADGATTLPAGRRRPAHWT